MQSEWMGALAGLLAGGTAGWLAWWALAPVFDSEVLKRRNFRDREVPVGGGLVLVLVALAVGAGAVVAEVSWGAKLFGQAEAAVLVVVLGFALLGFVDDVVGSGRERGFRGHVGKLMRGQLTAGGLKLLGGAGVALLAVHTSGAVSFGGILRDGVLVALAANLANLFDLAPGRVVKVSALSFVIVLVAAGADDALRAVAVVVGASLALLWPDLRERVMLGDTGANALGAALGLGVVLTASPATRLAVMVVLLALNVASEFVSFSRLIERVPPLRALDAVGRMR